MIAFYFFNSAEFQDMLAPMVELAKTGRQIWVCFFDCLDKKRTFFNYTEQDLTSFIGSVFEANNLKKPKSDFYGLESQDQFEADYKKNKPYLVCIQGIYHKYPRWMPHAKKSKVIHFAWGADGFRNLSKSNFKVALNVLRNERDVAVFKKSYCESKFFGKFWKDQLSHSPVDIAKLDRISGSKVCLMPETWVRTENTFWNNKNSKPISNFIRFLHDNDFLVVCKRREKGYPFHEQHGWSNYVDEKPDFVIDKDLYYPSSLFSLPSRVNACVIFGHDTPGTLSILELMKGYNSKTFLAKNYTDDQLKHLILSVEPVYNMNKVENNSSKNLIEYLIQSRILDHDEKNLHNSRDRD